MPTLLEKVAKAAKERTTADGAFRSALVAAKEVHSWRELRAATGLSEGALRHHVREAGKETS